MVWPSALIWINCRRTKLHSANPLEHLNKAGIARLIGAVLPEQDDVLI